MGFFRLLLGALCVWRITHLLNAEDGPGDVFVRLRRQAGAGVWGELLDCFYCLSLWIAAPLAVALGKNWRERLLLWPALSGGAILLERVTDNEKSVQPPAAYFEHSEEATDGMLRQEEGTVPGRNPNGSAQ
jgi:Protein of unknown function (DUF1360)